MKEITKLAPRIATKAADWYKQTFTSLNAGAEFTLEAIPTLYKQTVERELKGKFSKNELMLILDSENARILTPAFAGQGIVIQVQDSIALDQLDAKWGIDKEQLNEKLGSLTIFQAACLEIWTQAFWKIILEKGEEKIEKYAQEMAKEEENGSDKSVVDHNSMVL